ncbi:MAG TPA: MYG1 family protein [Candidatus Paceibacterota bacterium]
MKKVITHNGGFHADEVCAVAMLGIYLGMQAEDYTVVRTRDPEVIATGDYVIDVGHIYNEAANRFDHHQQEGAGIRHNGIPYASCGLVWRHFGYEICNNNKELWQEIEDRICIPVDAHDNGILIQTLTEGGLQPQYNLGEIISTYKPILDSTDTDPYFMEAMEFVKGMIVRILARAYVVEREHNRAREVLNNVEGNTAVFDEMYLWEGLETEYPDVHVVVYPKNNEWRAETVRKMEGTFSRWVRFPEEWGGLSGEELQAVSGIEGLKFCHRAGFLLVGHTKEAVLAGAEQVVPVN